MALSLIKTFLFWILGIFSFALFGFFYQWVVIVWNGVFFCIFLFFNYTYRESVSRFFRKSYFTFLLVACFTVLTLVFHHGVPEGRDFASYLSTAKAIVDHHGLKFQDDFLFYFPSFAAQRENSKGVSSFEDTRSESFTSNFLPLYPLYLASFYQIFGYSGFVFANTLLIGGSLFILYLVLNDFVSKKYALFGLLIFMTSFFFNWFPRQFLSENLSLFIFWLGFWLYRRDRLMSLSLFCTGAICHGMLMLVFLVTFFSFLINEGENIYRSGFRKTYQSLQLFLRKKNDLFLLLLSSFLFLYYFLFFDTNYKTLGYSFLRSSSLLIGLVIVLLFFVFSQWGFMRKRKNLYLFLFILILLGFELLLFEMSFDLSWKIIAHFYVLGSLWKYNWLLFALTVIGFFIRKKNRGTDQNILFTLCLFPSIFFLLDPKLALDHPWMMRRYVVILFPMMVIFAVSVLEKIFEKNRAGSLVLASLLVSINISSSYPIYFFQENKNLKKDLDLIADRLQGYDLVIFRSGWEWQQISYYLHFQKNLPIVVNRDGLFTDKIQNCIGEGQTKRIVFVNDHDEIKLEEGISEELKDTRFAEFKVLSFEKLLRQNNITDMILGKIRSDDSINSQYLVHEIDNLPPKEIVSDNLTLYLYEVQFQ